jgi:penicillin-binding protein-related factor A (putative recombinase)
MPLKNKITEPQIQKAIMQFLRFEKIQCWRINTVGIPNGEGAFRYNNEMRGMADICLIYKGLSVWFEVKTATGKQSPHQKEFQTQVESAGGFYFLVRSVEDAVYAIKQLKVQRLK